MAAFTQQRLAELETESTTWRHDLERLRSVGAEWRSELRDELERLGRGLQQEADRLLASVWVRCETIHVLDAERSGDVVVLSQRLTGDLGRIRHDRGGTDAPR